MSVSNKLVICGAGFLGTHIARTILTTSIKKPRYVQISSRNPSKVQDSLESHGVGERLLPAIPVDITKPDTLHRAFSDAKVIVSLVGIMHGSPKDFEEIQWKGAENVAKTAKSVGAKLIHFSAIGADLKSNIPYVRTKALAEKSILEICPDATIIRPSLVFGPEDDFFNRFSRLSRILPFLPVFGGGVSLFQPVYVGDLARAVEIITRDDANIDALTAGKIIEAGGPEIFTYRELMEIVLKYSHRHRPIISVPFAMGILQGAILERLPLNLFTVSRAQVQQLKTDNITSVQDEGIFQYILQQYSDSSATSVHRILPTYLG